MIVVDDKDKIGQADQGDQANQGDHADDGDQANQANQGEGSNIRHPPAVLEVRSAFNATSASRGESTNLDVQIGSEAVVHDGETTVLGVRVFPRVTIQREVKTVKQRYIENWPSWVRPAKVQKIKDLNCFAIIHDLILNGLPAPEVARHIQLHNELPGDSPDQIRQFVEHYRATIPKSILAQRHLPKVVQLAAREIQESVDVVKEMSSLFFKMKKRFDMNATREDAIQFSLAANDKIAAEMKNILMAIAILKEKYGVTDEQVRQAAKDPTLGVDWDGVYGREGVNQVIKDPAARMRVLRTVEGMLEYWGKKGQVLPAVEGIIDPSQQSN